MATDIVERKAKRTVAMEADELAEWVECLDDVALRYGKEEVEKLLSVLSERANRHGVRPIGWLNTPYINTIRVDQQPEYAGDGAIERRIRSLVRWNAMAMVVRANREFAGIGGHISTYASAATLFEVGFQHFFHARSEGHPGDFVYFQGHATPGVYARAFLEGRLSEKDLERFRRETPRETGLSSYPHPWLMPGFWQFPTVSMGLSPLLAIYQARFLRYLQHRQLVDTAPSRVWCFVGDGEMDEPESVGALTLAAREKLDNLTFVVNCNLQRLDGPVRGNGKIIQELESLFRGCGWNVIKVIWGSDWDPLLAADEDGLLVRRMNETVDGQYQKYTVESGEYIREHFFGTSPELQELVAHLSDRQLEKLNRGGHDPNKVYAAYRAAVEHRSAPTVVLAKTIKGYGLGETGEGRNITHKQTKLNEAELLAFRDRFDIPLDDDQVAQAPFFRPTEDTLEIQYLRERRERLGGFLPARHADGPALEIPPLDNFDFLLQGTGERAASTTISLARMLHSLLKDEKLGQRIVPIIPDEARTFGLETLFARCGIYSPRGQLYEPVDADQLIFYKESRNGQLLEEGITEAGAMASFVAAGTAYSSLQFPMIPFYLYYSMFGFQRIGDLIWAAADARARGFLLGCTAGRTTLSGEGLQHQDGHSPLLAATVPTVVAYDPAYGYEVAVIVHDGLRRLYGDRQSAIYYLTLYNESYPMPPLPQDATEGIVRGLYQLESVGDSQGDSYHATRPQLFGSGPLLQEVRRAATLLAVHFGVSSNVWSVTSYSELRRDCLAAERWNRLHPDQPARTSYLAQALQRTTGPYVAATDYMKAVPDQIARWVPGPYVVLGTDGFGRSDTRPALRDHFEVSAEHIALAALSALVESGQFEKGAMSEAIQQLNIDPEKLDPAIT